MRDVYVVKHAIATSLGNSVEAAWQRLLQGHSALDTIRHFHADRLTSQKACCIPDWLPAARENRVCDLTSRVLDQITPVPPGTCVVWAGIKGNAEYIEADQNIEMPYLPEHYHQWVAEWLGIDPTGFDINAACASSTVGMAVGAQKIARGEYGSVLVCAADVVTRFAFSGFSALKAFTPTVCRPFDKARDGMCIGDGAVAILLADAATARKHKLDRLAHLSGWGISNDANHITGPSRGGAGLVMAIETAMGMAGLHAHDTQAFCAHGTGTIFNDSMELAAIEAVFGDRRFPVFSIKGAVGHTLGAAGGIDAAICAHALAHKLIPPTVGLQTPESKAAGRVSHQAQAFDGRNIVTSNSGFGGVNAALVLHAVPIGKCRDRIRWPAHKKSMKVNVIGGGWVTAVHWGRMTDGVKPIMAAGDPLIPPVEEIYLNPPVRYRRFDSYCQIGCAAVALALKDAGMDRAERTQPIGIIASTRYGCFETDLAFYATAREEEGIYASPNLFAFTLPGIAISEAAIHFKLTGPTFTVGDPIGQRGHNALGIAVDLLSSGTCRTVLTGWLDAGNRLLQQKAADDDGVRGAIFIALSTGHAEKAIQHIRQEDSELLAESGMKICAIMDLVN